MSLDRIRTMTFTVLAIALSGSAMAAQEAVQAPTFSEHVAPIFYQSCADCHRPGEIGYIVNMQSGLGAVGEIFRDTPDSFTSDAVAGAGAIVSLAYVIQPLSLFLIYFAIEGGVRLTAALVTRQVVGTLSLVTLAWIHSAVEPRYL